VYFSRPRWPFTGRWPPSPRPEAPPRLSSVARARVTSTLIRPYQGGYRPTLQAPVSSTGRLRGLFRVSRFSCNSLSSASAPHAVVSIFSVGGSSSPPFCGSRSGETIVRLWMASHLCLMRYDRSGPHRRRTTTYKSVVLGNRAILAVYIRWHDLLSL